MEQTSIYQHFRASERNFIEKVSDWVVRVSETYTLVVTDFLNPRQIFILTTLANAAELQLFTSSAVAETEYVKAILAPSYYELDVADFELALLQIDFASQFVTLKHSQILGTFLGETGLERAKIGDIVVHDSFAQVFVEAKLVPLFIERITKIARSGVKIREIDLAQFVPSAELSLMKQITVSSLRLDKAIAGIFNISRNLAQNLIQSSKVKVNYVENLRNDFELDENDLISVRGFGRFKIVQNLGLTKKEKLRVEVKLITSKI
ncbi:cell division protein [Lactococcus hodotermopsidis]|uniref:Cell division protein n=1 Tax=Pseudolactococcus hodotermopsidis TaxID=2709157 RepID=A0A6A0BBB6_9LACT|nr:YlmH/Sll1252 family protein [Lactococcus hodotermopsidis]GFH42116.1 cell division protein [Lactococcus hodotermopsidis]